jgi:Calx-beta domain-containing protein
VVFTRVSRAGLNGFPQRKQRRASKTNVAQTGTLTFAPGETTKTVTIEVKGDSKKEADESFYLDLFDLSSNALFTKNRGTGTILNDD